jgi:hypothetical protein
MVVAGNIACVMGWVAVFTKAQELDRAEVPAKLADRARPSASQGLCLGWHQRSEIPLIPFALHVVLGPTTTPLSTLGAYPPGLSRSW